MKNIWRKVIDLRCGFHVLECGHEIPKKPSQPLTAICRCRSCEGLKAGTSRTIWPTDGLQEVWDATAEMPIKIPWSEALEKDHETT